LGKRLLVLAVGAVLFGCSGEAEEEAAAPDAAPAPAAPAPTAPAAPAPKPTRRFVEVTGTVQLDDKPAAADMEIPAIGKITTGPDGHAVITLAPGGAIEIRKGSTVTLGSSDRKKDSLQLALGAIWSFLPQGSSYEVVTPNTVAGVRGTVFYVEAASDKDTYVCACDGEVEIDGANKKSFSKSVKSKMEHKAFRLLSKGKKQVGKKEKRLNHTDAEKDAMLPYMDKTK
jgi:hypothetical protein